jgi:TonB family protein
MATIITPKIPEYGARELKVFIQKATQRAFIYTYSAFAIIMLLYIFSGAIVDAARTAPLMAPIVRMDLIELPSQNEAMEVPPPPPPQTVITGPAARAGTPIAVPDAEIAPDLKEFAEMEDMSRASAEGGDGVDLGDFSSGIDFENQGLNVGVIEEEPDIDDFIAVEVEPGVELGKLQKLVEYPEMAKRAGIEGRVVVKVLVAKTGEVKKIVILTSDNSMLNNAALTAIKKYGDFTPAIQNKQPVMCWVAVPITFRLR